jgi:hypothetical protein
MKKENGQPIAHDSETRITRVGERAKLSENKGVQSPKITDISRTWEPEMSVMFLELSDEIGPRGDGFFNNLLRCHVCSPGDFLHSIDFVRLSKSPRVSGFGRVSQKSHAEPVQFLNAPPPAVQSLLESLLM